MSAPLDLIVVLRKLGACDVALAWLARRRREDPGASFAKRWDEAGGSYRRWVCCEIGHECICSRIDASAIAQRGLYMSFLAIATPAEVKAARMVRR